MKTVFIFLILSLFSHFGYSQSSFYAGIEGGITSFRAGANSDDITITGGTLRHPDYMGSILIGANFDNNWIIESGYTKIKNQGYIFTVGSITELELSGGVVPLRLKKGIDFRFLKKRFSFLSSLGLLFIRRDAQKIFSYSETYDYFYLIHDSSSSFPFETVTTHYNIEIENYKRTQLFIEASATLKTPFIFKNTAIFLRTGYAFGIRSLETINMETYRVDLDKIRAFTSNPRYSYFNAVVGLQHNLFRLKKASTVK